MASPRTLRSLASVVLLMCLAFVGGLLFSAFDEMLFLAYVGHQGAGVRPDYMEAAPVNLLQQAA